MERKNTVGATERTFRIIETLSQHDGMGVTALANELSLPKSTIHNHLNTLKQNEYIVKENGIYRVGYRFLELGSRARSKHPLYDKGHSEVDSLAASTGELVNIATEEYGQGVYLYLTFGDQAVELDTYPGKRFSLHCTALGKAILAHLPTNRVKEIIDTHGLPARTSNTITDEETLFEELAEVRDRGFARDKAERLEGLHCVAAPIMLSDDQILGAISISAPTSRMKEDRVQGEITEQLLDSANVIELKVAYN